MNADDSDSSLSSTHSTDDEELIARMTKPTGINRYFKPTPKIEKEPSPEPPKRAPSPPHDFVLADEDAIAFLVMFRSRFSDAFPKSLPHYGPQDIERGIAGESSDEDLDRLLCALLSLVLNRKKDVERGHYNRALEDALGANKHQWPTDWNGQNPLPGEKTFNSLTAKERLILLKTLALWALNTSDAVQMMIKESYKQTRRDDDKNQPKSVQPWFSDSWRRRYYLIEGAEDTHFRIYRENDGKTSKTNVWFSVAGTIEEAKELADKFDEEGTTNAKLNADRLRSAIPRWEAGEEKRRRRDYRLARKAAFARPEPGFSLYEGRTRGKRMKYTYLDEEDDGSDYSGARSTRHSRYASPSDTGPTITASGRQVKSRVGGMYGESMLIDQKRDMTLKTNPPISLSEEGEGDEGHDQGPPEGRNGRGARPTRGRYAEGLDSESESDAAAKSSGNEWNGNEVESDEDDEQDFAGDDDEDDIDGVVADDEADEDDDTQQSLVVQLRYKPDAAAKLKFGSSRASTPGLASGVNGINLRATHGSEGTGRDSTETNGYHGSLPEGPTHDFVMSTENGANEVVSQSIRANTDASPSLKIQHQSIAEPALASSPPEVSTLMQLQPHVPGSMDTS